MGKRDRAKSRPFVGAATLISGCSRSCRPEAVPCRRTASDVCLNRRRPDKGLAALLVALVWTVGACDNQLTAEQLRWCAAPANQRAVQAAAERLGIEDDLTARENSGPIEVVPTAAPTPALRIPSIGRTRGVRRAFDQACKLAYELNTN